MLRFACFFFDLWEHTMAEVSIMLARTDQGFVRDLNAALQKLQRDTWINGRSIPDSAEWRALCSNIEAGGSDQGGEHDQAGARLYRKSRTRFV